MRLSIAMPTLLLAGIAALGSGPVPAQTSLLTYQPPLRGAPYRSAGWAGEHAA